MPNPHRHSRHTPGFSPGTSGSENEPLGALYTSKPTLHSHNAGLYDRNHVSYVPVRVLTTTLCGNTKWVWCVVLGRSTMQDSKTCNRCGNDSPEYKSSDRHRGFYECECGESITVDYYA